MTINEIQDQIVDDFSAFDDWMDKYQMLIELGNNLEPLADEFKTPQNLIEGCQSRVWIQADFNEETRQIHFTGDSDAVIVKGLVSLILSVFNNQTPDDILNAELYFIEQIGLREHLSPTRSNGLLAMVKQMRVYALAFKAKMNA